MGGLSRGFVFAALEQPSKRLVSGYITNPGIALQQANASVVLQAIISPFRGLSLILQLRSLTSGVDPMLFLSMVDALRQVKPLVPTLLATQSLFVASWLQEVAKLIATVL